MEKLLTCIHTDNVLGKRLHFRFLKHIRFIQQNISYSEVQQS
jgi:hypothetical protein